MSKSKKKREPFQLQICSEERGIHAEVTYPEGLEVTSVNYTDQQGEPDWRLAFRWGAHAALTVIQEMYRLDELPDSERPPTIQELYEMLRDSDVLREEA